MITYNKSDDAGRVSGMSLTVIHDLLTAAGIESITITSVQRTPEEQARAMFKNCAKLGVDSQLRLYGPYGDAVIDIYSRMRGQPIETMIAAMTEKIESLGPGNVSHHCADPAKLNVVDLSARSLTPSQSLSLERAIRNERRIVRHFSPHTVPSDPAFHIEIPQ